MTRQSVLLRIYMALLFVFLFGPLVVVVLFSFHETASLGFPFEGFSLRWYRDVFGSDEFRAAAGNSLRVSLVAGGAVLAAATPAALVLTRYTFRGASAVKTAFLAPNALPFLFIGIALLTYLVRFGIQLSLWTVTLGHIVATLPIYYLAMTVRLTRFDAGLEESARVLGASAWYTFRRVTLPLILPAILGGLLLVLATSWDELFITLFTTGTDSTLPVLIWTSVRTSNDPSINVVASVLLATSLFFVLLAGRLSAEITR
jgi:spermidine/putrescine transport system permease protein